MKTQIKIATTLCLLISSCHREVPHFCDNGKKLHEEAAECDGGNNENSNNLSTSFPTTTEDLTTITSTTTSTTGGFLTTDINTQSTSSSSNLTTEDSSSSFINLCGNGIIDENEICDDGINDNSYDGCMSDCMNLGPFCGDGLIFGETEYCDDSNNELGDGCDHCIDERLVFVTSETYDGTFSFLLNNPKNLKSIQLADERCNILAKAAGLNSDFKAWLSNSLMSPIDRFDINFPGKYILVNGTLIVEGWINFTTLQHPINEDENGNIINENIYVWTNTSSGGLINDISNDCNNWSEFDANILGNVGNLNQMNEEWTDYGVNNCSDIYKARLYCIEDSEELNSK